MKNAAQKLLPTALVSHFTPSLMAATTLEAILVEREDLASELVEEILGSATNPTKAQTLLVGPRGIGKTHLVTLVYHRIHAAKPKNLCIAWLREEEYGVVSWLDLLLRVFRSLEEEYPGTTPRKELEPLFDLPVATAEREAQILLQNYLAGRTLWLLVENIDAIFSDIKEAGQRKWRSWMQEHAVVTTLATTPGLFSGISGRNAPFYGFFRIEHLQPLDVDGAVLLLQKLARVRGDEELASFIDTPAGHARVRAVHHLAGGNFRIYVVFASFLKRASLDELVAPFLQLLDELTPYYQSHLAALSAQQRKIIEVLCDYRGAMPVKLLASRGFMSQQTASSQLVDLKERGYVIPQSRGRESLYELREPLLRLCLEVKKQRGEPVALLIEFLRLWYRRDELSHHLESCAPEAVWEREYLMRALAEKEKETEDPVVAACERALDEAEKEGNIEKKGKILRELIDIRGDESDWMLYSLYLLELDLYEEAIKPLDRAIELNGEQGILWSLRALALMHINHYEEALESIEKSIAVSSLYQNLYVKGVILRSMRRLPEALKWFDYSLKKKLSLDVLFQKAQIQTEIGQFQEALKTFRRLEKKKFDSIRLWSQIAMLFDQMHDFDAAIEYRQRLLNLQPDSSETYCGLAYSSLKARQFSLALESASRVIELDRNSSLAAFFRAQALLGLEDKDGFVALRSALVNFRGDAELLMGHLTLLFQTLYFVFEKENDADIWAQRWKQLIEIFDTEGRSPIVSTALTQFAGGIAQLVILERETDTTQSKPETRPQARKALEWSRSWSAIFDSAAPNEYPSLRFAARLSAAAIQVAVTGDDRSLFDLPSEERAIVREILDQNTPRQPAAKRDNKR